MWSHTSSPQWSAVGLESLDPQQYCPLPFQLKTTQQQYKAIIFYMDLSLKGMKHSLFPLFIHFSQRKLNSKCRKTITGTGHPPTSLLSSYRPHARNLSPPEKRWGGASVPWSGKEWGAFNCSAAPFPSWTIQGGKWGEEGEEQDMSV